MLWCSCVAVVVKKKTIFFANVRDQVSPLASGAIPAPRSGISRNCDRSPAGTGISCIALLGFCDFSFGSHLLVVCLAAIGVGAFVKSMLHAEHRKFRSWVWLDFFEFACVAVAVRTLIAAHGWLESLKLRAQLLVLRFKFFCLGCKFRRLSLENRNLVSQHREMLALDRRGAVLLDDFVNESKRIKAHGTKDDMFLPNVRDDVPLTGTEGGSRVWG